MTDVCGHCGEPNDPHAQFCATCRAYLGWDARVAEAKPASGPIDDYSLDGGLDDDDEPQAVAVQQVWVPARRDQAAEAIASPAPNESRVAAGHRDSEWAPDSVVVLPAADIAPGCPRCGSANDPQLRFCHRCGETLADVAPRQPRPGIETASRPPWWRRWLVPNFRADKDARRAFRRSLPLRYRLRRVLAVLLVLVLGGAGLTVIGHNPVGWVRDRVADVRNTLVRVPDLQAVADPPGSAASGFPAANIVDDLANTAWATAWKPPTAGSVPCAVGAGANATSGSVRVVLARATTVRAVAVAPGLTDDDPRALLQWRPKIIQLGFSDGTCQPVALANVAALQQVPVKAVSTTDIRITVFDAYPPSVGKPTAVVAISEIFLFSRP